MSKLDYNRILLIHPLGYQSAAAERDISRIANIMPPLGLASIASYLEQEGIRADIIDCYARPGSDRLIREYLVFYKPAFIGLSCTTSSFLDGVRLAGLARQAVPGIKTVFGGPHVSALREQLLADYPEVDIIVAGEGEETLKEVILNDGRELENIPGLIYLLQDKAFFTGYREVQLDLDSLPFPAYEKLAGYPGSYRLPIFNYPRTPNTSCTSSRGCPYACSYCDRSVFRRSFRYNSAGYLYEHMAYLKKRFNIRHINFYDDQFTFKRDRVEHLMTRLIDRPLGMTFNCAVRAEHVDQELLALMKKAGCWMISLGIETGDENLLARHRQNADLQMLAEKIRLIKKNGIRTKGLLMMGLPGETEESIKKSMSYVFSLPIDDFNLAKFTPFPGSPLYKDIHNLGEFEEDWARMDCMSFLFTPEGMSRERLDELFIDFYRQHFKRPRVFLGYAAMLYHSPDSWRRFLKNGLDFLKFARSNKRLGS
ncbi:MAG: B12-binding domain-containing radical SAM protein [Thermodesulfobacteriota bacterium]